MEYAVEVGIAVVVFVVLPLVVGKLCHFGGPTDKKEEG